VLFRSRMVAYITVNKLYVLQYNICVTLFFKGVKNRISFLSRFEHICHSLCEICDRSRFFYVP